MNTTKDFFYKIKKAGENLLLIGYSMIANVVIAILQVLYLKTNDNLQSLDNAGATNGVMYLFISLYVICTAIIIYNLIEAGRNLASCEE
jgi:hypothetical protein